MILAAGGTFDGAATPDQADIPEAKCTAAGAASVAREVLIANIFRGNWRRWSGRCWRRLGRVATGLGGVGCHHGNTTLPSGGIDVALHADVPSLTPLRTP